VFDFQLHDFDPQSQARRSTFTTPHGPVEMPAFMPVGTQGTVKGLTVDQLLATGAQMVLGNTYHLALRPGEETVAALGGLHRLMGWDGPILTDSGGFQVFSLAKIRKIKAHGVEFRSHLDGSPLFLGPKEAMEIQRVLGADIAMVFDECPPHDAPGKEQRLAVERTIRWAAECREQPRGPGQLVFGIVQGGSNPALREECAKALVALQFDGYAIGGVSVGEPEPEMMKAVELAEPFLPANQARYAMGLGTPAQLVELVARGVDMFDCVLPTRVARNGTAFTRHGTVNIKAGLNKAEFRPIEDDCDCFACQRFTRAYLRHLLNVNEILGLRMLSVHNSHMFLRVMADIRSALAEGTFGEFRKDFIAHYRPTQRILLQRAAVAER
jgi:queuine tRNA-ribosyltransferase